VQGDIRMVDGGQTITGVMAQTPPVLGNIWPASPGTTTGICWPAGRHTYLNGSDMSLQIDFDQSHAFYERSERLGQYREYRFQHHLSVRSRNDVVWGLSYRVDANRFAGDGLVTLDPSRRTDLALWRFHTGRNYSYADPVADAGLEIRAQRLHRI